MRHVYERDQTREHYMNLDSKNGTLEGSHWAEAVSTVSHTYSSIIIVLTDKDGGAVMEKGLRLPG